MTEDNFIEESVNSLRKRVLEEYGKLGLQKVEKDLAIFAGLIGKLNYKIYKKENVTTCLLALGDVYNAGLPAMMLRLQKEENANIFPKILKSFAAGALSIAVSAGREYLERKSQDLLDDLAKKISFS